MGERLLVDIDRLLLVAFAPERVDVRNRGQAACADADRINLHLERLRGFGGGQWRHFAGVVLSVGHEDDDFAFRLQFAQTVQGRRQRGANRGLVLARRGDFEPIEILQEEIVVQRQWGGDVGIGGKGNQTNAVVGAFGDKFLQHVFRDHQPVDPLPAQFKIFRTHAAGKVDGDDNIDAARCDFRLALAKLGPGERDDEQCQGEPAQFEEDGPGARAGDAGDAPHQLHRRIEKGGLKTDLAFQPRQHRQQ